MHFKRFEIQGYKSFATRTQFQIDPGITAVVGPNGSGKSNIMDALRWVIGGSASGLMRARRMEDVIFAGSESRAPAGLAEARIVLDNSAKWLPLDAPEVEVVRRVHRSGESEYRINDTSVRLRDIQELFARGGLGPGSQALMGQGLVEEVLRLRPEDRRGLIEEVAGVRGQRLRMIDSRRKRAAAEENLARARLLVAEIAPRLRTVERQAGRAIQHAELSAELQAALRDFYGREWRRLGESRARRGADAHDRAGDRAAAESAASQAEAAMERCRGEIEAARERLQAAAAERRRLDAALRDLESKQAITAERRDLLRTRLAELDGDIASLRERLDEPQAVLAGAVLVAEGPGGEGRAAIEAAAAAATAAAAEAEEAQDALDAAAARLESLRRARDEAGAALAALDREAQADNRRLAESAQRVARIRAQLPERERALRTVGARLAGAEAAAEEAQGTQAAAGVAAADAHDRRAELARDYNLAAARLRDLETARSRRERDLTRARDRLQMLRELQGESEGMHQGLRALFGTHGVPRDGEPTGIPGVAGVLRRIVHAPRGLERAIEAALADYLNAVIFTSADEALSTMTLLVQERAGRIVALPLDATRARPPLAMSSERGVIGVASQMVRCRAEFRGVVDTLLGRTVIVEDLTTGREIVKRGLGAAVTRDGYLLRPNGALSGGRLAETGAFEREAELRSLPEQIEHLQRSLAADADVDERRRALDSLGLELQRAEGAAEEAAAARARAQEAAGSRRADVSALHGEAGAAEAALARAREDLRAAAAVEAEVAAADARRAAQRETVSAARPDDAAMAEASQAQSAGLRALAAAQARVAAAQAERRRLDEADAAQALALRRAREALADREARRAAAAGELAACSATLEALDAELAGARRDRDAGPVRDNDASPQAQALARLLAEEPARREAVARCQSSRIEAEKALVEAQAALRESETALERLHEAMGGDDLTLDAEGRVGPLAGADTPDGAPDGQGDPDAGAPGAPVPPPAGPPADASPESDADLRLRVETLRGRLRWLGKVNPEAAAEFAQIRARHDELTVQIEDLEGAERRMLSAEAELSALIQERFADACRRVDAEFQRYFRLMFRGGAARLLLTDEDDLETSGVDLVAQPPGKRVENLSMLSGGERSLTAIALLFALLEVRPAPFCVLDEVDAALDEANVGRFVGALKELAQRTQFVVITHNRRTIEQADSIYGVTMGEDSVSRVLSVRLVDLGLDG